MQRVTDWYGWRQNASESNRAVDALAMAIDQRQHTIVQFNFDETLAEFFMDERLDSIKAISLKRQPRQK